MLTGAAKDMWTCPLPFIPGYDLSGVIETIGADVADFKEGDEVFATNWGQNGHADKEGNTIASAFAEYIDLPAHKISLKPRNVSHHTAAAISAVGVTALQVLQSVPVDPGARVLVLGGSSAVGTQLIQQAKLRGAHVTATASSRALEYVKEQGADRVINYNEQSWWLEKVEYDIVIDAVGETDGFLHAQTEGVVKYGGSFLTISNYAVGFNPAAHAPRFTFAAFFGAHNDAADQTTLINLVAEGKLKVPIEDVFPFTQEGVTAIFNKVKAGKSLGKNVLKIVA